MPSALLPFRIEVVFAARALLRGGHGGSQIEGDACLVGALEVATQQREVLVEHRQFQPGAADDAPDAVFQHLFLRHAVDGDRSGAGAQRAEQLEEATAGQMLARRADDGVVYAVPQLDRQIGRFTCEVIHEWTPFVLRSRRLGQVADGGGRGGLGRGRRNAAAGLDAQLLPVPP